MFKREIFQVLLDRMKEKRRFIQVLLGPRQVGKTTISQQIIEALSIPSHYASADEPTLKNSVWLEQQWNIARLKADQSKKQNGAILILDEIQKISDWSETVKKCWDEDTKKKRDLKVVLLGSSSLLVQRGLTESLAGRFEIIYTPHWSFNEMHKAFHWDIKQYIYFGGYPGAAALIDDENRWMNYINDSLIETTISRDILLIAPVTKPALLRRLFSLGCQYSGEILSYQKMLGQLQDVGNTTTLAHYLDLLNTAGMLTGIQKYAGQTVRRRSSSPKLQVLNTALMSAQSQIPFQEAVKNGEFWGRLTESSIGAYLVNSALGKNIEIYYWREGDKEVDFVLKSGKKIVAIEVKSNDKKALLSGMEKFSNDFKPYKALLVGSNGILIEEFLKTPIEYWFQ